MVTKEKKAAPKAKAEKPKKATPKKEVSASAATSASTEPVVRRRRQIEGVVVSDKMQKTIVVRVDRRVRHSFYKKYLVTSEKYKAHDEKNEAKIGDRVTLVESRPLSRDKRWALQSIIRRAGQAPEVTL